MTSISHVVPPFSVGDEDSTFSFQIIPHSQLYSHPHSCPYSAHLSPPMSTATSTSTSIATSTTRNLDTTQVTTSSVEPTLRTRPLLSDQPINKNTRGLASSSTTQSLTTTRHNNKNSHTNPQFNNNPNETVFQLLEDELLSSTQCKPPVVIQPSSSCTNATPTETLSPPKQKTLPPEQEISMRMSRRPGATTITNTASTPAPLINIVGNNNNNITTEGIHRPSTITSGRIVLTPSLEVYEEHIEEWLMDQIIDELNIAMDPTDSTGV
jgi:hypothetical protein